MNEDHNRSIISQQNSIFDIKKRFGEEVENLSTYNTPSVPYYRTFRTSEKEVLLDSETQTIHRSGVGMILYMVKFSRPDLSNAVG